MKIIFSMFIFGLSFGWGPCLAACGPLLLTYICGTGKGVRRSIIAYLLFSFSRIAVYLVLGLAVFFLGRVILERFGRLSGYILAGMGIFIVFLGILMLLGKNLNSGACVFLKRNILDKDAKSVIILGIFAGLLPCAPLITALGYSGLTSGNLSQNLLNILSFGLGTALSPLIILVVLAGLLPGLLNRLKGVYMRIFGVICGLIMIAMGAQLIGKAF